MTDAETTATTDKQPQKRYLLTVRESTHRRLSEMVENSRPKTTLVDLLDMIVEDVWRERFQPPTSASTKKPTNTQ